jgi:hypothetical protein
MWNPSADMNKYLVHWLEGRRHGENVAIRAYLSRVANLPALPVTPSAILEQDLQERQGLLSGLEDLCGINQDDAFPPVNPRHMEALEFAAESKGSRQAK